MIDFKVSETVITTIKGTGSERSSAFVRAGTDATAVRPVAATMTRSTTSRKNSPIPLRNSLMSLADLKALAYEAAVLAGAPTRCDVDGHKWKSEGGRACPFHRDGCGNHSQTVYRCEVCGDYDYGDVAGSRGFDECASTGFDCGGCADESQLPNSPP
jgi:hypothetical protein